MTDETKIVLVLGGISILLCCWAYYHCLMRQREKYDNLKKAFAEDFPNSWGDKREVDFFDLPLKNKPKRPRLYKQATVVTKGELPAVKKPTTRKAKTMPLKKSTSKAAFTSNVKAEVKAGKKPDQAVAIAYSVKREAAKAKPKGKK